MTISKTPTKVKLKPKSNLGKWSVWLLISLISFSGFFLFFIKSGEKGGSTFFSNLKLTIPYLLASASGTGSFITGTISIIKNQERSPLVFLSVLLGLAVFLWNLTELAFPH